MCGIAGAFGPGAGSKVLDALRRLEYRGYDSAGAAWADGGSIQRVRAVGPVEALERPEQLLQAIVALGHTRWATHGGVHVENAHPHTDCTSRSAVVHNGVLLNHTLLRAQLESRGHRFTSATDSEALVHLWEEATGTWHERMRHVLAALRGTYSLAILDAGSSAFVVAKRRNPLWLAQTDRHVLLASDPVALRAHADKAVSLEDDDIARVEATGWQILRPDGTEVQRPPIDITHLDDRSDKAGYEHFMLKEMHEAPMAINRLLAQHVRQEAPYIEVLPRRIARSMRRALMLGAGTSFHAGLLGASMMQRVAGIPASARPSPEHKDDVEVPEPGTVVWALSQSGETLDTLQALHRLASHPHRVVAVTNHPTSTIGRMSEHVVPLRSGAEVSVAATKTFLAQALVLYLAALQKAHASGVRSDAAVAHASRSLVGLPRALERTMLHADALAALARRMASFDDVFVLAKGMLLPVALEAALKLKEIAYQHAEAAPAGELKHGPFALLTKETAVLFLVPSGEHAESLAGSIAEVRARDASVFVVADETAPIEADARIPTVAPELQPFVFAQAVHMVSYWVARARGLPIDRPRNLAKSVTVE